ncbi:PP0621 family protein [Ramlibacter sp. H39-3-26]|uniref:PP0621 family protein n=1 Tax=Curvibacter soli TaxID=3031331 RepID=UPI0023DCDE7C|nr:PP0621 family protein [Ramlibacter sp. H39-3-26]MDF1484768.1 PP0621 family protein [Ramlibacter sp. H39-3-26]
MKFLVLLVVLVVAYCVMRRRDPPAPTIRPTPPLPHQPMARCAVCDMHVPASEAIVRADAAYCCADHLRQATTGR